uniref:Uncharacterized protein n=1 Tax=Cacopsylla melanoneura TaxID=428564 RepID=A0A8D9EBD5_9HEMI
MAQGQQHPVGRRKIELLKLVKRNIPPSPRYVIDWPKNTVTGLSVCPLTTVSSTQSNSFGQRINTHFTFADLERRIHEAIQRITPEDWRKAVEKYLRVSKQASSNDEMVENAMEEVVISLTGETSSSE